jgi:hypothetical protein
MKIIKPILLIIIIVTILSIIWWFRACLDWMTFWTAFAAIGSFFVAISAIYGDFLRSKFIGPKLKIVPYNLKGDRTTLTEYDASTRKPLRSYLAYYYHLKVVNYRPFVPAKNCRVMLRQLHRLGPDREFHPEVLVVPYQYVWSPAEWAPAFQTVADEEVLDFGRISQGGVFQPTLYVIGSNFKGYVNPNDSVRFSLQIVADNYVSPRMQIFQVDWNGKWADTPEDMSKNLIISEVSIDQVKSP